MVFDVYILLQAKGDDLPEAGTRFDLHRKGQRQRGAVSFETRVRPVTLVFSLKNIALKFQFRPATGLNFVCQAAQVRESGSANNLGFNQRRKPNIASLPIGAFKVGTGMATLLQWMQYTKPDAITEERRVRFSVKSISKRAVSSARNLPLPAKIDISCAALDLETQLKAVCSHFLLEPFDLDRNSAPIPIPNRNVNAAEHFAASKINLPQKSRVRLEKHR
jgi:hypothetical protein